jgi:thiol-disulfide isomerase/thioredoxin
MKNLKASTLLTLLALLFATCTFAQDIGVEGKLAPDFTAVTQDGKEVSLSDYKGKVVYIDFWASWCGPCKREMPHAEKVKKHFKGKQVVFLNVSVDRNESSWRKILNTMNVNGVNAIAKGEDLKEVAYSYQLRSIPAFVLVDKKGKLVAMRANRPSSQQAVIDQIDGLL